MYRTALAACAALAALAAAIPGAFAQSSQRYSPPPALTLSPDLAAPWVTQLSRKPSANGARRVEVAPPASLPRPRWQVRETANALTPLQADPVRRERVEAQPVSAPARPERKEREFDPQYEMQMVEYQSSHAPGTIVIDTQQRFLYLVEGGGMARRYGVGVGREGFEWQGTNRISRKAEWPDWRPPAEMIAREKAKGKILPAHMPGGPENPLGARALYLGDSLYRIHGTNQPWSIGQAVSSGCIRMRNEDVIDLYERVKVGAKVVVS